MRDHNAAAGIVALACAFGVYSPSAADAQQCDPWVFTCPNSENWCIPTGPGSNCNCAGLHVEFQPLGICQCSSGLAFFEPICWGPSEGGGQGQYCCHLTACGIDWDYEHFCTPPGWTIEPPDQCPEGPAGAGSSGASGGPSAPPPPSSAGEPVSLTSGHTFLTHVDARVGELVFSRTYHTGRIVGGAPVRYGSFGLGWNHSFEGRLTRLPAPYDKTVEVRMGDGRAQYYFSEIAGEFQALLPYSRESSVVILADGTYRRNFRAGGAESYDASGKLTSVTDRAGVVTSYSRDAQGRLVSVSRLGRTVAIEYDATGNRPARLRAASASGPVLVDYAYDAVTGQVGTVTYPDGSGYRYTYDQRGRIRNVQDLENKLIEAHTYYPDGPAYESGKTQTSSRSESSNVEKLTFSYYPGRTVVVDAVGNSTTYWFTNVRGTRLVTEVSGPCASCGGSSADRQLWAYDAYGRIIRYSKKRIAPGPGPDEHTWLYEYDAATGDLLKQKDPLGREATYTYDTSGRVLTVNLPDGGWREFAYDPPGPRRIREKVGPASGALIRETNITYEGHGKVETITDPRGKVTTLAHDATTADLLTVTAPIVAGSPGPLTTTYTYYADTGRLRTVEDGVHNVTTYGYDGYGRVTSVTDPAGKTTGFSYDHGGRRKTVTDALNRVTTYGYDDYGRLETVTDARLKITRFGYHDTGRLASITDARNKTTAFEYDGQLRLSRVTYPGTPLRTETYTYDPWGHLETRTDRRGTVTTYGYDGADQLTTTTYSDGTPPVTYTYDSNGRVLTAANGTDTVTRTYDLAGQLLSEGGSRSGTTVSYQYDLAGNRRELKRNGQLVVSYTYDDASRLQYIDRGASRFEFKYDAASRRTDLIGPRYAATSYGYDAVSRLLSQVTTVQPPGMPAIPIVTSTYTYDWTGNRITKGGDLAENYVYDEVYRLTDVSRGTPTEHYGYDDAGNRLRTIAAGSDWTYSDRNELLTTPSAAFTYDANGNLSTKTEAGSTWAYEWNAENQLTRVTKNAVEVARYSYDPLGRRIEKLLPGSQLHTYVYDGEDILWQDFASPLIEGNLVDPAPHLYIHGPGIDEPLAVEHGNGAVWYYHSDGLGSVVRATDQDGNVVSERRYDAFGNLQTGADAAGYAFTAREWDPETGLHYYRARYYDPKIGRFVSEDPIGFGGGINFYAYVLNNPVRYTDPSGLELPPSSTFGPHRPAPQPDPNAFPWSGAWQAQQRHFPWDPDPYGGAYRHCVAACLVGRITPFAGSVVKAIDWLRGEDPSNPDSRSDMQGGQRGLSCSSANNSCESECLKFYPELESPFARPPRRGR